MKSSKILLSLIATVALLMISTSIALAHGPRTEQPSPIVRGPHVSGVVQMMAHAPSAPSASASTTQSCSTPGGGNLMTDCASTGLPVNETSVATNGSLIVAGANDYNSYNGQGQDGYFWSTDGTTWNDAGPIDVFPHNNNNGAGDPGLAVDSNGVVYYSSLFFNFYRCNVGGVELLRRDPNTGTWSYYQIAADSNSQFQDKPAIALDEAHSQVFVSWTQFGSCSGSGVASPIRVAILPAGTASVGPSATLNNVPGSTYSQGSTIKPDGTGGFWIAWEEYSNSSTSATASIRLAHYTGTQWATFSNNNGQQWETISPPGFTDLPSPLPGFSFRDNSFPELAMVGGEPWVVWTSYDSSNVGRTYLWAGQGTPPTATASRIADSGGDQFFPAITADGTGGAFVSYSQDNGPYRSASNSNSYDQYVVDVSSSGTPGTPQKVTTASSYPNQDALFSGQFIGDYNGMTLLNGSPLPIWTDIRGTDPNYPGYEMDSMTVPGTTSTSSSGSLTGTVTDSVTNAGIAGATVTATDSSNASFTASTDANGSYSLPLAAGSYTVTASATGYVPSQPQSVSIQSGTTTSLSIALTASSTSATAPSAPQNLKARSAHGHNATGVQLTWSAPATDGGSSITGYDIYRSTSPGGEDYSTSPYATVKPSTTSYNDTGTSSGVTYYYTVTAVNSVGESAPSNEASAAAT